MKEKQNQDTREDKEKLLALGIPEEFLALPDLNFADLYEKLRYIRITELWQIQTLTGNIEYYQSLTNLTTYFDTCQRNLAHYAALSGNPKILQWLAESYPDLLAEGVRDSFGMNIAYYAACAGHIEVLQWIDEHCPERVCEKNVLGDNISHSAAKYGQTATLQWIDEHYPELFVEKGFMDLNIAAVAVEFGQIEVLQWIATHHSELLVEKNAQVRNLAYLAAQYGQIEVLQWIKEHCPKLLVEKNKLDRNLAYHAAKNGQIEVLQWIKEHYPELLVKKNLLDRYLAHYAAQYGQIKVLQWIKEHCPELLIKKDFFKKNITQHAAINRQIEVLQWIKEHCPELNAGLSVIHLGLSSGNRDYVNLGWSLMGCPESLDLRNLPLEEMEFVTLGQWLDSNYSITSIDFQLELNNNLSAEIGAKLSRNREFQRAKSQMLAFVMATKGDLILPDLYPLIFNSMLHGQYSPEARLLDLIDKEIDRLSLSAARPHTFFGTIKECFIENSDEKLAAFYKLRTLITTSKIPEKRWGAFEEWERVNSPVINRHRNKIYDFVLAVLRYFEIEFESKPQSTNCVGQLRDALQHENSLSI